MSYYDDPDNVAGYIAMAEGYDGRELVAALRRYLKDGAAVLELGMGPGKDLAMLGEHYEATGSDISAVFVDRYRRTHPEADLLVLDARTLETDRRFDAIYSNKVLQHLTRDEVRESFQRQAAVLNRSGLALHTFWRGEGEEIFSGLLNVYYTEEQLRALAADSFEVIELRRYAEMDEDDSLLLLMRRKPAPGGQPS